ncbi:MAG: thiamine-phosphate kinase [Alistipes sp.]|jgi:thiamine-monophosphate kinase|nr:thiamine-phosphate kinase [Alistipes sp.]
MRTEISELGKFGLMERLNGAAKTTAGARAAGASGDDGALLSSALLLEGVDFDLTYFPLRHLGYKAVAVGVGGVLAAGGVPVAVRVALGVSAKLSVEDLDELWAGVRLACGELGAAVALGDVRASVTGLAISVSVAGRAVLTAGSTAVAGRAVLEAKECVRKSDAGAGIGRSGARENDLICITRDLGAAYLGLHLLEREKRALAGIAGAAGFSEAARPKFEGYEYLLERQLKPRARKDIVDALAAEGVVPTAMAEISDGLAGDLMQICRASEVGARVYLDRLPIARESYALAEELHIDPVVAAMNGGDDHELLFTVPLEMRERVAGLGVEIVGHITAPGTGAALVTPDGSDIPLRSQGFND